MNQAVRPERAAAPDERLWLRMRKRSILTKLSLAILVPLALLLLTEVALRCVYYQRQAPDGIASRFYFNGIKRYLQLQRALSAASDKTTDELFGPALNCRAWEASFEERGSVPPNGEPKDGYWGSRILPQSKQKFLRYTERQLDVPGLVKVDDQGFQTVGPEDATVRLLFLGGSVGFGAYASTLDHTYFAQLSRLLGERGVRARIDVLAAGAWVSHDELTAFALRGLKRQPHIVVFLDGLNDLTNIEGSLDARVADYLANMRTAKAIAAGHDMKIVFALQPFLPWKKQPSELERRILLLSGNLRDLGPWYEAMRNGLRQLCDADAHFIDCSDALSDEPFTTFADQWHFSDPGHRLVAERFLDGLLPLLEPADPTK